ncbi:MAG: hypothetical protein HGN29_03545 [Asgard group archaeon]|nr:hypothetical protein [Asgard group archaeon]
MRKMTFIKRKLAILFLIVLASLLFLNGERYTINVKMSVEPNDNLVTISSLTPHPYILITDDGDFTSYSFSGDGSESTPYLIENYNITTGSYGIYITGTTKHFKIRNCYIDSITHGIYIKSVQAGTAIIINNTCEYNSEYGIFLEEASGTTLENNTCNNNNYGIYMMGTFYVYSTNIRCINNTCNSNTNRGIQLIYCSNILITENECKYNIYGINTGSSSDLTLINNTCNLNEHVGIDVWGSNNNVTLINNKCTENCTPGNSGAGIRLSTSTIGILTNNTCDYNNDWGIFIYDSSEVTLINNTCRNSNSHGINLQDSFDANLINNTCNYNDKNGINVFNFYNTSLLDNECNYNLNNGIYVTSSPNATLTNNVCKDNINVGLFVYTCHNASITENELKNNNIQLGNSNNASLEDNFLYNCGLVILGFNLDSFSTCSIENNWVNGKLLGFFTQVITSTISSSIYGQLILIDCSDITISDQVLFNTSSSISLYSSDNIFITNNVCANNSENGIFVSDSYYITISENTCNNNTKDGIYAKNSKETFILNNECGYNSNGITLYNSSNAIIFNNTCNNNKNYGIYLTGEDLKSLAFNELNIKLTTSDQCLITYNRLIENDGYGIYLKLSNNNLICYNSFIDNNLVGTSQAYDSGNGNNWYNTSTDEGNYWSDWSGTGSYNIDGGASSTDPYPLSEIPVIPVIGEYSNQNLLPLIALIPLILIGTAFLKRRN